MYAKFFLKEDEENQLSIHKNAALVFLLLIVWNNFYMKSCAQDSLYTVNQSTGNRSYYLNDGVEYLDRTLSTTGAGEFSVIGKGENSVLSGYINGTTTQGHFFKLTSTNNTVLNLKDLTISDASRPNAGGSVITIENGNTANLDSVTLKNNSAYASGGAIYNTNSNLNIKNSMFDSNASTNGTGGVIVVYGTDAKTVIDNSVFQNNKAPNTGVIYITESDLILTNTIFRNNESNSTASGSNPGALRLGGGSAVSLVENCLFENNISGNNAGAVYSYGDTTIKDTGFKNNYANFRGGAMIVARDSNTHVTGSYFENNSSQEFAGAIYNDGNLTIDNTSITGNQALHHEASMQDGRGGAIYNSRLGVLTLNQGTVLKNNHAAGEGGAVANSTNGLININGAVFDSNISDTDGGAIWNLGSTTIEGGSAFINNSASGQGGAIWNGSVLELTSDTNGDILFQNNTSGDGANDIYTNNRVNINGEAGTVAILSGISGTGVVNKFNNGTLYLEGDSSKFTGDYNQRGGTTAITNGKWFGGSSNIEGGTLDWGENAKKVNGVIKLSNANLNVYRNAVLDLDNVNDTIAADAVIYLDKDAVINNYGTVTFNQGDNWQGRVNNNGNVILDNYNASASRFSQSSGNLYMHKNSLLTVNADNIIRGGNMTIDSGSTLTIADNFFSVNNLTMDNGTIDTLNGSSTTNYILNDLYVSDGGAHFNIDFDGDNKISDVFEAGNITGNGTISVDAYNVSGSPYDIRIPFPVFKGNIDENTGFAATNDSIMTPLYRYSLVSEGGGVYSLIRNETNPSINRGAESVEAMFLNNIGVINMIFEHVYIDSEQLTQARMGNKNIDTVYMPYQDIRHDEGSIWYKPYITYNRYALHNGNMMYATAYGSILGFDFPTEYLENDWKFLPTAFITYQGGRETAHGDTYYQNGGMGGFMGTFFKGDSISSLLAYGGGYNNEMQTNGYTDQSGNWYAGAAAISAYNFHPKKNIIIQPIVWAAYNILGKQNWTSNYGDVPMSTGYLNGLAVSPGVNAFWGNEKGSIYGTISYVFTINDHVKANAGPVEVDSARLRYGFLQYGVGFIRTWKDRFLAYGQVTLRQGGATGVAFWGGLTYRF